MKNLVKILFVLLLFCPIKNLFGQDLNSSFKGAIPSLNHYRALYFLDDSDTRKVRMTLRNINNALEDPRLKGKVEIELVAFSDGYNLFKKSGNFENQLLELQKKGVILAQCENTLKERKVDKSTLFNFIGFVPSGNGEIIIRGQEGWSIIHP